MLKALYKKYWPWGFGSGLYDFFTPTAYKDSLKRAIQVGAMKPGEIWLDAGCGSGQAVPMIKAFLKGGGVYLGVDILEAGLAQARHKAKERGLGNGVKLICSYLIKDLPIKSQSVDGVLAHFSVYALGDNQKRWQCLKSLHSILKPNGKLVVVNPLKSYNASKIIQESLIEDFNREGYRVYLINRFLIYPLTRFLGLRFIEKQLQDGLFKAYSEIEMCAEIEQEGFTVLRLERIYADSAYLILGEKKSHE